MHISTKSNQTLWPLQKSRCEFSVHHNCGRGSDVIPIALHGLLIKIGCHESDLKRKENKLCSSKWKPTKTLYFQRHTPVHGVFPVRIMQHSVHVWLVDFSFLFWSNKIFIRIENYRITIGCCSPFDVKLSIVKKSLINLRTKKKKTNSKANCLIAKDFDKKLRVFLKHCNSVPSILTY